LRSQLASAQEAEDNPAIVEIGRRIVALAPNNTDIWESIARAQFDLKDFDRCAETLDAWQKAMRQGPAAIEDFRGDLAVQRKNYPDAERHWRAFLARKPSAADAAAVYDKLAELCVDQARWADCATYRTKAIGAEDTGERRVARARALLRLHHWDEAFSDINKANAHDPSDETVKQWLPQFELLRQFLPRIKSLDTRIAASPADANLLLERARLFTLADRPELALPDCEEAIKSQPASMRARIQTGEALLDLKRPEDAAKLQVSDTLTRERDTHVREPKLRELAEADAQIAQNPRAAEPLAARAHTLRDLRQHVLALADAQAALALDANSVSAHIETAENLDRLDQPREALAHITKATEINPSDSAAWYHRGILEAQRADFAAAIQSLTHSIEHGESIGALRARARCERRIGRVEEADADLRRIRQLDPTAAE
jgi:tetratricopeptide (TPR) repeat protein